MKAKLALILAYSSLIASGIILRDILMEKNMKRMIKEAIKEAKKRNLTIKRQ